MKIQILKADEKTTATGKELKKCMMEAEGRDFPYNNVTVWSDCPIYKDIVPGYVIEGGYYINVQPQKAKEDNSHINPKNNKPYNNYTLYQGEQQDSKSQDNSVLVKTVADLARRVSKLEGVDAPVEVAPDDEINPEDIPF